MNITILLSISFISNLYCMVKTEVTPAEMENLGATCYMNSTLQCLFQIQPLTAFIANEGTNYYKTDTVAMGYVNLIKKVLTPVKELSTKDISVFCFPVFEKFFLLSASELGGVYQQDAHEFLEKFIDCIADTDIKTEVRDKLSKLDVIGPARVKSFPSELFGTILDSALFPEGSSVTHQKEFTPVLLVNIEKRIDAKNEQEYNEFKKNHPEVVYTNLKQSLDDFFSKEKLDKSDWYKITIDGKKTPVPTEKKYSILETGPYLIITLKRNLFAGKFPTFFATKLVNRVIFPLMFDLKPYFLNGGKPGLSTQYELFGWVQHRGSYAMVGSKPKSSGHYTSYVKTASGQWYSCNDTLIEKVQLKRIVEIAQKYGVDGDFTPYILFYKRKEKAPTISVNNQNNLSRFKDELIGLVK